MHKIIGNSVLCSLIFLCINYHDLSAMETKKNNIPYASKEATFQCLHCPKKLKNKYNLAQHVKHHQHTSTFTCDICNKTYKFEGSLRRHQAKYHPILDSQSYREVENFFDSNNIPDQYNY